jgi:c(7)-type cytochrome triheme protein
MKNLVTILGLFGVILLSGVYISAQNKSAEEQEPYDEDTYGPEADIVWNSPVQGAFFSHKIHTMDMELECDECHDELFEMEAGAAEANDDFTMASMAEGNYCGACHDGSTAFSSASQCASCHMAPKDPVVWTKPVKAVIFEHVTHTEEAGMDCESCHDDLFIMKNGAAQENDDFVMASLYEGNYCGACHDGSTAFASDTRCTSCHIGVRGYARLKGEGSDSTHGSGH